MKHHPATLVDQTAKINKQFEQNLDKRFLKSARKKGKDKPLQGLLHMFLLLPSLSFAKNADFSGSQRCRAQIHIHGPRLRAH